MGKATRIVVTGATGFLGKHLVEQLRAGGQPLRLLCRTGSAVAGAEVVRGDVTSAEDVNGALEGAGEVYHLAGLVSRDPKDAGRLYRVHIEGTRNVCEAALRHGVEKVVAVSSSGTIAVSREPSVHDEHSGYKHDVVGEWPYYLSKMFAEKLALAYARERRLPVVIANPSLLLGPGDERGSSTGDVSLFLRGELLAMPAGGVNFVDARDVAQGLIAAMRAGRPGERYLMGGVNWSVRKLVEALSELSGVAKPKLELPAGLAAWGARLLRGAAPWIGQKYQGPDEATVRMAALYWYCDSSKARAELGFQAQDPIETLRDTIADLWAPGAGAGSAAGA
ncbi:MAG: NAD-dependent epimerase/dehydratase family protein [Acidobacteria bacterium]|nr:NAD-dependent epimerase/dehydratase family protein [Acidobacteriota bacterium]